MQRISILTLPTQDQQELDRETLRWLLRERNGILCYRNPPFRHWSLVTRSFAAGSPMKWMLVVLVGGMTPVQTDVIFEKLSDCLLAEEQLRKAYTDALMAWDKQAAMTFERRRDYVRARELQARKLDNSGTCIPHTGGGQPIASSKMSDQPASTSPTTSPASPSR